ncbi:MAG: LamG-like jellyroll fold domain-containing protein, partial [Verrucomicrobiota bacterium]
VLPGDVTQPGDPIIASSANSPGSEGVANAIDGQPTKYLNFDSGRDGANSGFSPSGFVVTPSVGLTRVIALTMQSANDGPERDPTAITLEGSNDDSITTFNSGTWEMITAITNIPAFTARFQTQPFAFDNAKYYKSYRWTVTETATTPNGCCLQIAEVEFLGTVLPGVVTQPGDPLIASSANSPGSEGVANAIDGQPTKYLNFDSGRDGANSGFSPSGFVVTPSIGDTLVTALSMQSANDGPERDPKAITLEGSNDDVVTNFTDGTWSMITTITNVPTFTARFQTQTFVFQNYTPYKHYRWIVTETATTPNGCCMQIAEVGLHGTGAPQDVTQPGDPIIASSSNSPGSEGVANAIDGQPTKYLNFDSGRDGTNAGFSPSGFVVTPSIGATTIIGLAMESANDGPERDPTAVTLEGSNDDTITSFNSGNWELITSLTNFPPFTARFQRKVFGFPNTKSYKSYRWTVTETATTPNGCCLQIAEVEFLALTSGADCNKARFVTQPVDTPVVEGSSATFFVTLNGPWPLQWYRNGQPISGAVKTTYTTDPITQANATNVYTAQIVGCEASTPVKAVLFQPSSTKSIGISFAGGGANGAPTSMNTNDITGVQLQAFWNNALPASADLPDLSADPQVPFVDSDNQPTTITFTYATSGTWGAGTGIDSAVQRMLNGLILDTPAGDPATLTFNNVPDGAHTILVYVVSPPLQFQDANYKITGTTEQTYYIRAMNSDEYNAAPGFYRGSSTDPNNRTIANFVRFENVHPLNGTITLSVDTITTGYDRGTGVNGIQLLLNAAPAGTPPSITAAPQPTVVTSGGTAKLSVTATGANLTYQWRKNGKNLPNGGNVSGATSSTLTIGSFGDADEGIYSVAVFNPAGSALSKNASVRLSKFDINESLVAYFKFDETSGATAANSAPGGVTGTVNGTAVWGAGKIANALTFDGSSTYVQVSDYTKAQKQLGVSGWVNVAAGTAADVAFIRNARGALAVGGNAAGQFELGLSANVDDGTVHLTAAIGAGPNIVRATAPGVFTLGSWQQVAFSADGAQLRLYVNGQEVASTDYGAAINPPNIPYLSIGARLNLADPTDPTSAIGPDSTAPNLMSGPIDDLAVWTRALSADEVAKIFAAGSQGKALTTVVVDQQPPPGDLEFNDPVLQGSTFKISWTGTGRLQESSTVNGTYTDVPAVEVSNNSYSADVKTEGPTKFYRLIQ